MVANEDLEHVQRWTAKRRTALVLSILKGETNAKEAARKHGLTVGEVEERKAKFLSGAENARCARIQLEYPIPSLFVSIGNILVWVEHLR